MALSRLRRRNLWAAGIVVVLVGGAAGITAVLSRNGAAPTPGTGSSSGITRDLERPVPPDHPRVVFREAAAELGVRHVHGRGRRSSLLPEDMGPGAALEDLDGDGDLDLFLVNLAGPVGRGRAEDASPPADGATHRLYENVDGTFRDVTAASGLGVSDYGIGVAAGDFDGDGRIDLYVTAYGPNRLFRNLGALRFEDVTARAGVGDDGFGAGAAFGDGDGDGDLDLYVCNYVRFRWDGKKPPPSDWGVFKVPYTLNPSSFPPAPNRYYENRGDGTFDERAAALGIDDPKGRSLAVTFADFSGDGRPDLYVLNDISKNAYFESREDGGYADRSIDSLSADYRGAMGNAVGDVDGDGDLELFITHWIAQENAYYRNLRVDEKLRNDGSGPTEFQDDADRLGLGQISLDYVGWGTAFLDYDLDGLLDLAVVNGSTMETEDGRGELQAQRPLLFWQKPGEGFFEVGRVAGAPWSETWNARGLVDGDLDGDGDLDLVVTANRGPVRILLNEGAPDERWLRVRLRQPGPNRHAVGAQVRVHAGARSVLLEVGGGTSYLCHRPCELTFGLGGKERADAVEVRWPDGRTTVLRDVAGGRIVTIDRAGESTHEGR